MKVGFRSGLMRDESRTDWDGTGPRPISWAAWYPGVASVVESPMRVGGPGEPWFDIGAVARDAPFGVTCCPVVLVSHGTGGSAASMGWIARRLAHRGFVAIAVDHHGNTAIEPYSAGGFLCWWERARDFSVLLDHLANAEGFAGHIDPERVTAVGFSLGCHTALSLLGGISDMDRFRAWAERNGGPLARGPREFPDLSEHLPGLLAENPPLQASWQRRADSYCDPRVRAAILLAPAPPVQAFKVESLAVIAAPVHILVGEADVEAPPSEGAEWLVARLPHADLERLPSEAGHYVFLPEATEAGRRDAPALCVDAPGVDRRAIHDAAAATAERLFASTRGSRLRIARPAGLG